MTTTVTVTVTTAEHAARISTFPCENGQPVETGNWELLETVFPRSTRTFHVHSKQDILVQELSE